MKIMNQLFAYVYTQGEQQLDEFVFSENPHHKRKTSNLASDYIMSHEGE